MPKYYKYPRTFHVPWSESSTSDDVWHPEPFDLFKDQEVVVTLKKDGENTNAYKDHIHARSMNSGYHESRTWVKNLHAQIKHEIPDGYRICGENLYAFHSIFYTNLPSYFLVFSVWDDENNCLSWDDTKEFCELLNLIPVPVIYEGIWNEKKVKKIWEEVKNSPYTFEDAEQKIPTTEEGYVIRLKKSFTFDEFKDSTAKFVRANHVRTNSNWMTQAVVPNLLS